MKVLVCGSREWRDFDPIANRLSALPGEHEEITVIHGGAKGADRIGARAARMFGFTVPPAFRPDYERYGRYWAPKQRTLDMLNEAPDLVLAFTLGTGGTQFAIDEAKKRGIPVEEIQAASPRQQLSPEEDQ